MKEKDDLSSNLLGQRTKYGSLALSFDDVVTLKYKIVEIRTK